MNATVQATLPLRKDRGVAAEEIQSSIQLVLLQTQPLQLRERRRGQRHPFPYPVLLSPVGVDGITPSGDPIVVLGKHLSSQGLDFYHSDPLPDRFAIATFECIDNPAVHLLLEMTWCRFGRHGLYENGGRFIQAALPASRSASG